MFLSSSSSYFVVVVVVIVVGVVVIVVVVVTFDIFVAPADGVDDSTAAGILCEHVCFVTFYWCTINTRTYVVDASLEVTIAWLVSNKPNHHGILNTPN